MTTISAHVDLPAVRKYPPVNLSLFTCVYLVRATILCSSVGWGCLLVTISLSIGQRTVGGVF